MIEGNFILVALISIVIWLIYRIYSSIRNKKINIFREIVLFIFFVYFLFLLLLTMFKGGRIEFSNQFNSYMYREQGLLGIINIVPIKDTINTFIHSETGLRNSLRNVIGNILVFMPLGFFIPLLFDKLNNFKKVFKIGFLSSLAIELCQLFVNSNVCDIDDVIYNTLGAVVGFICYRTFEMIMIKINLKNKLDKIRDFHTNNILKKIVKGISIVIMVTLVTYVYAFYNQFNGSKFYLIKDEFCIEVRRIDKHAFGRYVDSKEGYSYIENGEYGYRQEFIYNDIDENRMIPIVFGNNTNAKKVVITLKDKIYEQDIKDNESFMVIYPEIISFDKNELEQIYNKDKSNIISIKFVDDKGKEIKTLPDLDNASQ